MRRAGQLPAAPLISAQRGGGAGLGWAGALSSCVSIRFAGSAVSHLLGFLVGWFGVLLLGIFFAF